MDRRVFIQRAGMTATVLVASGMVWRAQEEHVLTPQVGPAFTPWTDWQMESQEPLLRLVRAAILAASPHNSQPWLFKITENRIEVYADRSRNTGALDPDMRELHIGLGCAIENLMLAAGANGYKPKLTLLPGQLDQLSGSGQSLVAFVDLTLGPTIHDEVYDAIPRRHTNRNPYDLNEPVKPEYLTSLEGLTDVDTVKTFLFTNPTDRARITSRIREANDTVYADPEVVRGSDGRWDRLNQRQIDQVHDGLTYDCFGQSLFTTALRKMLPQTVVDMSYRFWFWRTTYAQILRATPVFGVLAVRDRYSQEQCLQVGRVWQRTHLWVTARGIAARPVNELVELVDLERAKGLPAAAATHLSELVGSKEWQPTFMFRMGYPMRTAPASPRRSIQEVLLA